MVVSWFTVLGVVLSVVASMALGMLWYSAIFGKAYLRLRGITQKDIDKARRKGMAGTWVTSWIANAIMVIVLAVFLFPTTTLLAALVTAFLIWLGFVTTVEVREVLFGPAQLELFLINTVYSLLTLLISAVILYYLH